MDWDALERRPKTDNEQNNDPSFKIPVKKVAVSPDKIRKLPDGTVIVIDDEDKEDAHK